MKKGVKVLSLGLNQINFIGQLYGAIKKKEASFSFDIDNFYNFTNNTIKEDEGVYNEFFQYSEVQIPLFPRIRYCFKILVKSLFWRQLFLEIHWNGFRNISRFIKYSTRNYYTVNELILPKKHDVYHFHSIVVPNIKYLQYLPKTAKIVCTFWGLDLLDRSGNKNYYYVRNALNRANVITVQTKEMKEFLLVKFGRHLKDKVKPVIFPLNKTIFEKIDCFSMDIEKQISFKKKNGIYDDSKTVLSLAYHAGEISNHIPILKELDKLPLEIKKNIVCVLPLTYQRNKGYLNRIDEALLEMTSLQVIKIEHYLSFEEVALLRIISNIAINAPEKDALTSVILEVLYANNVVIAGNWLPYHNYKRAGLTYIGFDDFSELSKLVAYTVTNYDSIIEKNSNKKNIEEKYLSDLITNQWIDIYKE